MSAEIDDACTVRDMTKALCRLRPYELENPRFRSMTLLLWGFTPENIARLDSRAFRNELARRDLATRGILKHA